MAYHGSKKAYQEKNGELYISSPGLRVENVKNLYQHNLPEFRIYRDSPDSATIQLRSRCGIGEFGSGVKRDMVATGQLGRSELLALAHRLTELANQMGA